MDADLDQQGQNAPEIFRTGLVTILDFAVVDLFLTITDSRLVVSLKKLKFEGPHYTQTHKLGTR
jgi:hypothetical protein